MQVLIVEDDSLTAELLETVVAGLQRGMRVFRAATLGQALELWQRRHPELLVIDWNLPDGDGLQLIRAVRARDEQVAIVMVSSRKDRTSILRAAQHRIDAYISKPFNVEALHSRLQALVSRIAEGDGDTGPVVSSAADSPDAWLAEQLQQPVRIPSATDAAAVVALMEQADKLSVADLAGHWRNDVPLCARLLALANGVSFRRTGKPVEDVSSAIALLGVPMSLNCAMALALDVSSRLRSPLLCQLAPAYQELALRLADTACDMAQALAKPRPSLYYSAGLLSRLGELAVLAVMDQYVQQGHSLTPEDAERCLRDWAGAFGNRIRMQWCLSLDLRRMIGAVYRLPPNNPDQNTLIMRAAALLTGAAGNTGECRRLLRQLGLERWYERRRENVGAEADQEQDNHE